MEKIKCLKYTPVRKGFLEASIDILVEKWGIEILEVKIFNKEGRRWVSFPTKMSESNGKKSFYPYIRFANKEHMNQFTVQVLESVKSFEVGPPSFPVQPQFFEEDIPF